jgi:hypothetical protein
VNIETGLLQFVACFQVFVVRANGIVSFPRIHSRCINLSQDDFDVTPESLALSLVPIVPIN